jgi:hypothetical protein
MIDQGRASASVYSRQRDGQGPSALLVAVSAGAPGRASVEYVDAWRRRVEKAGVETAANLIDFTTILGD